MKVYELRLLLNDKDPNMEVHVAHAEWIYKDGVKSEEDDFRNHPIEKLGEGPEGILVLWIYPPERELTETGPDAPMHGVESL